MNWKVVVLILLEHRLKIESKPVLPCQQSELTGVDPISELASSEELARNAGSEQDNTEINEHIHQGPCEHTVVIRCGRKTSQLPVSSKDSSDPDELLASMVGDAPQNLHARESCPNYDDLGPSSQRSNISGAEDVKAKERRNRMFEGLLKFTTILNRIDSFFTEKAKNLIRGLNKMVESGEETEENNLY